MLGIPLWLWGLVAVLAIVGLAMMNSGGGQDDQTTGPPAPQELGCEEELARARAAFPIICAIANRCEVGPADPTRPGWPAITESEIAGGREIIALIEAQALVLPSSVHRSEFMGDRHLRPGSVRDSLKRFVWENTGRGEILQG